MQPWGMNYLYMYMYMFVEIDTEVRTYRVK